MVIAIIGAKEIDRASLVLNKVQVCLKCGCVLYFERALLSSEGITAWGEKQETCGGCNVEYVER